MQDNEKRKIQISTEQEGLTKAAQAMTKGKKGVVLNPTGKGGFADNPQNRNPGGWKKEQSISYQLNRFMRMTEAELDEIEQTKDKLTMAEKIAIARIRDAAGSGKNINLSNTSEIVDRVEGRARQSLEVDIDGAPPVAQVVFAQPLNELIDNDKATGDSDDDDGGETD